VALPSIVEYINIILLHFGLSLKILVLPNNFLSYCISATPDFVFKFLKIQYLFKSGDFAQSTTNLANKKPRI